MNGDLGYEQAMQLRTALMPIAYLLCTTGLLLAVFRHWGNFHEILMSIIGIAVIVILINGYPTALTTVADAFKQLREQTTANAPGSTPGQQGQGWTSVFDVKFEKPSWDQIAEKLEIAFCQMFKWIGIIAIWFLDWVQSWAFNGLIAISPVLLSALAVPWTQGTGVTFIITSFGVAAWHLGIALVDILLASIALKLFAGVGIAGGIAAGTVISIGLLPIFLGALAAVVCVAIALYLAVPLIIAAVLRGASPLTAGAKAGIEMTLTAFGLATMVGTKIAARQAATATLAKNVPPASSDRRSEGGEGGEETGMAPKPSPLPSGGCGVIAAATRRVSSRTTSGGSSETSGESVVETSAERQSRILAGYDSASGGRRSPNELERRKAEAMRILGARDESYT
jgi:hypothetical protein